MPDEFIRNKHGRKVQITVPVVVEKPEKAKPSEEAPTMFIKNKHGRKVQVDTTDRDALERNRDSSKPLKSSTKRRGSSVFRQGEAEESVQKVNLKLAKGGAI